MWPILLGLPGALATVDANVDTLLTRCTEARLAHLDADITSRAPASTALSTANYTSARAGYLDLLNTNLDAKVSEAGAKSPIAKLGGAEFSIEGATPSYTESLGSGTCSVYNSWTDIYAYTGSGVVSLACLKQTANANDLNCDWRLVIDDVEVMIDITAWNQDIDNDDTYWPIGWRDNTGTDDVIMLEPTPFKTNFKLQGRKATNSAGSISLTAYGRLIKTG